MGERLRCRWLNKKEKIYSKEIDNVAKIRDKNKRKIKMKRHKKNDNININLVLINRIRGTKSEWVTVN